MNLILILAQYKTAWELLAAIGIVLGLALGVHAFLQHEQDIGYQRAVAEYQVKLQEAKDAAKAKEDFYNKQLQDAQNAATQRDQTIRDLVAATGTASVSLRDTLGAISRGVPTATLDALRHSTDTLATVLSECQDRYRSVAEKADRHANDVQTLMQAWPR